MKKRLLKPHIYKTILALGVFSLYIGIFAIAAGHMSMGYFAILITMITMLIATNEEYNKQQMEEEAQ